MPYFDGRESGIDDEALRRVRDIFDPRTPDRNKAMIVPPDSDIDVSNNDSELKKVGRVGDKHLYPRPPTEALARELYINDNLTDAEFEHMIGQALEREGVAWGGVEADG